MLLLLATALSASPVHLFNADGEPHARMVYGLDVAPAGSREQTARGVLADFSGALGLQPQDELKLEREEDVVTFARLRGGVRVLDGEVKVTFDARGHVMMVNVGAPLPATMRGGFWVDVARAEVVAARGLAGVTVLDAQPVWRSDGEALRPSFVVRLSRAEPRDLWRALVDGETGALVYRFSERMSAGMASVYDISPAKGGVVTRSLGGLPATPTTLNGTRAVARGCDGSGIGGSCTTRAMPNGSNDFVFTPNPLVSNTDRFAEVQGYYQADRFSAWLTSLQPAFALPKLTVYTNVGNSNQGYYLGDAIELGQGPEADWAYEGDVIFHELGHGVVAHTSGFGFYGIDSFGVQGEGGSLNEGSADCLALGFANDPVLAEWVGPYLQDAGSLTTPYLRRMDDVVTCHGYNGNLDGGNPGRFGEIHDDGRIIGSFFWAVHSRSQSLAPEAASKAYLAALRSVPGSASYHQVSIALQQQMASLYGMQAGQLVTCLQCERDMAGCDSKTRRMYTGETHESRLLGSELPAPAMSNGERPATFQYELAVPANTVVTFDRFAITGGMLPNVYARFGQKVGWAGGNPQADVTFNSLAGATLPAQSTAGTWFIQGALRDPGQGTRRYGLRAQVPAGASRPAGSNLSCSLGGGIGSCTCTPNCTGRACGSDGCSGMCGACDGGTTCNGAGMCACTPQCAGKVCGPDGCGGSCGTCASGSCSTAGTCVGCMPQCAGKQCGPNGCGQACGQCLGSNEVCEVATGACVDAGNLEPPDGGTGGGAGGGAGGGGGDEIKGGCSCSASPVELLAVLGLALIGRSLHSRRRAR